MSGRLKSITITASLLSVSEGPVSTWPVAVSTSTGGGVSGGPSFVSVVPEYSELDCGMVDALSLLEHARRSQSEIILILKPLEEHSFLSMLMEACHRDLWIDSQSMAHRRCLNFIHGAKVYRH